jgi:hypothetical protein
VIQPALALGGLEGLLDREFSATLRSMSVQE